MKIPEDTWEGIPSWVENEGKKMSVNKRVGNIRKEHEEIIIDAIKKHQKKDHYVTVNWLAEYLEVDKYALRTKIRSMDKQSKVKRQVIDNQVVVCVH